jgi:hypothetical protein
MMAVVLMLGILYPISSQLLQIWNARAVEEQERLRTGAARKRRREQERRREHEEQERQGAAARERQKQQEEAAARERQRRQEEQERRHNSPAGKLGDAQALEIFGLSAGATEQEIRAAYSRLMKRVHPDVGGSDFLAKQLNAARDVLLG